MKIQIKNRSALLRSFNAENYTTAPLAAGFAPGTTVELTAISPGVIEIRISPPIQRDRTALEIMARIDGTMAKSEIQERGEK